MSLKNITPVVNWDSSCGDEYCDGYCDIHSSYSRPACDVAGCDSTISTYLVEVEGSVSSICAWHYNQAKDVA